MIRGLDTTVKRLRRKVFEEVARLGFEANDETLCDDMEAIPYAMVRKPCLQGQHLQSQSSCQGASSSCYGIVTPSGEQTGSSDCRCGGE